MTRLLVSVRDLDEARLAVSAGVDIVDLKEPESGALGPTPVRVWHEVARELGQRVTLSAACGELCEAEAGEQTTWRELPAAMRYVKFGLAGCAQHSDWREQWNRRRLQLPSTTECVAVAYADYERAAAPAPNEVLEMVVAARGKVCLVDTFGKDGRGLLDWFALPKLRTWTAALRAAGVMSVLAGSLTAESLPEVLSCEPDFVGVRGAVCVAGREGRLDAERLNCLVRQVRGTNASRAGR